ncbi:MAG: phosphatidate cytidylyltransferase [Bacteroidaceae bacterium]|nr:phosphatidate cytidylyltransferase [Bacteroidaceae bacterium]
MNRNLITRTITGLAFVAIVTGCVLWHPFSFGILFALFSGLTTWEFCSLMNKYQGCQMNRFITPIASMYLFGAILAFNANIAGAEIFIPYLITLVYLLIVELYFPDNNVLMNWAFTMMSQLYIALPFALLNTLAFVSVKVGVVYNPMFVLAVFIFIWFGDSAAYGFGTWLGKHRLFPRISPKKSWEGCIAAFVMAVGVSQAIATFSQDFSENDLYNRLAWAGLALVVIGFGTWGDLVESLIKRKLGIKDSGKILPGHGGMLDRFDSSLLAIPMAVVYIYTMNEILG